MAKALSGGCACGTVRYELASDPFDAGRCHCRTCQRVSGAPVMMFATVPSGDFSVRAGEASVKSFKSSSFGHRFFCGECGTPLAMKVDYQSDTVDFPVATLDRPDAVLPGFHIFWSSRVAWFAPADDLPRHDRFRPDTRGLNGTEPPT